MLIGYLRVVVFCWMFVVVEFYVDIRSCVVVIISDERI